MTRFIKPFYLAGIFVLIFIITRLPVWLYPMDSDHWIFWYVGKTWLSGGKLYIDAWDHKPPLIFLFNGLMDQILGANLVFHRILLTALALFDTFLFYRLSQEFIKYFNLKTNNFTLFLVVIIYTVFRNNAFYTSSGNNTENFALLFINAFLLQNIWLNYEIKFDQKINYIRFALLGLLFSTVFWLKPNLILILIPSLLLTSYIYLKKYISLHKIRNFFLASIAFLLPFTLVSLGWVWYFNSQHSLHEFIVASFTFSAAYAKSAFVGAVSGKLFFKFIILNLPILLFAGLVFVFAVKYAKKLNSELVHWLLLSGFFSLTIVIMLANFYSYYLLVLVPFMGLWSLLAIKYFEQKSYWNTMVKGILGILLILTVGMSWVQMYRNLDGSTAQVATEQQEVANYIRQNTTSNDKILAYTYGSVFYRLTERDAATRYTSASYIYLDYKNKLGFNLSEQMISDLERNKPKYVIMSSSKTNLYKNEIVYNYIVSHFSIVKSFANYKIWIAN